MRRLFAVIIAIFCLSFPAAAEVFAINFAGGAVAVDETGAAVIPSGEYECIYALFNDTGKHTGYAAGRITDSGIRYAVLNSRGDILTDFIYSGVWQAGEGCIVVSDGIYKYLSASKAYDTYEFSDLRYAGGGRILAVTGNIYDDIGDNVTILWPDGISFNTGISTLNGFGNYSEGLLPMYDDKSKLYGYVDTQGSWTIEPGYLYAGEFRNGLAIVGTSNGYGIIDSAGTIRLAASSLQLARSDTIFAAIRGGMLRVYDRELNIASVTPWDGENVNLTGDYIVVSQADSEAVMDAYANVLFTVDSGSQITSSGAGTFIVRDGSWDECSVTLRDSAGNILSDSCASIYVLDSSVLAYSVPSENGEMRYGLMGHNGKFITEAAYLSLAPVTDGMYCADTSTGAVLLDADGNIINTFKGSSYDADS